MIPPVLMAVAWIAASLAVFALTTGWLSKRSHAFCWKLFAMASGPALLGAAYSLYYLHFLPEPAWFYQWRSLPGSEILGLAPSVAGAAVSAVLPRWFRLFAIPVVVFLAYLPFAKPVWAPLDTESLKNQWKDGAARQSTRSTCGPASAATVLASLGIPAQESELAIAASSSATGTEAWYLARAIRRQGAVVDFLTDVTSLVEVPLPCIAGVKLPGGTGHFIPVMERQGSRYRIGDPLRPSEWIEARDLLKRYQFTGFYMAIRLR